jgi:membrane protease YdiL (CAAX protease family)
MYELLSSILFDHSNYIIRNSADIIFRDILSIITDNTILTFNSLLLLGISAYLIINYKKTENNFNLFFMFLMFIEGLVLGIILVFLLNGFEFLNFNYDYYLYDYNFMFYSCLGAGIWEEILFRFIFLNLFILITSKFFNKYSSLIISVFISSLLFSLFHYIGSLGDVFILYTFIIRLFGGIYLSIVYLYRGLGISMISHIIYDFILVTIPVV